MDELKELLFGIRGVDEIIGTLKSPSTILLAGTTGVGKTSFCLQILSHAAKNGEKTLYIPFTTESPEKLKMYYSRMNFFDDRIHIHPINRSISEKDPLSTLIDIGNIVGSTKPDRVVLDPVTPLGFGFIEPEKRRFFYTLDSMIQEWKALVVLTGEMLKEELHDSVVSHLVDGIIYLSREDNGLRTGNFLEVLKLRGIDPQKNTESIYRKYRYTMSSEGFSMISSSHNKESANTLPEKISSGVPGLDRILEGGLFSNSSTLVTGKPGTGKTTFGLQFISEGLNRKEPCVIVSFECLHNSLVNEAKKHGWEMEQHIDDGELKVISADPDSMWPEEHETLIKEYIMGMNAKRLFFDGIFNLEMMLPDQLQLRGYLYSLLKYLKKRNVASVFTTPRSSSTITENTRMDAEFLMDNIIILRNSEGGRRYMCVSKSKGTQHRLNPTEYAITEKGIKIRSDTLL
ncbi:MAG: circadian clock protein KaiC [Methanomethylovorans sp. PtaU1.Bin093]|jgi:circadian clock protein KaiC|uniref:ATPase domain-containing protein n=1 Tax=Methanomethylovorans sp. PtaU1.Bin093 TaxID=1811679 RepID=UPI0009C964ED|nr:ATPase domain-containing protein [Methanomethylovorans sp. PtaU1.Bin093]OPY20350.1 MAG: circadian clock protein KaiC [Methanomethylovorans sp. PtaU1.Bin093]